MLRGEKREWGVMVPGMGRDKVYKSRAGPDRQKVCESEEERHTGPHHAVYVARSRHHSRGKSKFSLSSALFSCYSHLLFLWHLPSCRFSPPLLPPLSPSMGCFCPIRVGGGVRCLCVHGPDRAPNLRFGVWYGDVQLLASWEVTLKWPGARSGQAW
jgi:hypothetical protein